MANDSKTILQKYVSDMLALEGHIQEAIDKQMKANTDDQEISSFFAMMSKTMQSHHDALEKRLGELGGAANKGLKEGVASVLGIAAGVVDKLRSDEISKDFRDDYIAINGSLIAYEMLYTTALAVNDQETAQLAAQNVRDNVNFINQIQRIMPTVVVRDLKKNYDAPINDGAVEETHKLVGEIWK